MPERREVSPATTLMQLAGTGLRAAQALYVAAKLGVADHLVAKRAVTIPHAMKLNEMLTKNQIICCGTMNVSPSEFERLT